METYQINFQGYRREEKTDTLPIYSGIYIVYRAIYNPEDNTVDLKELIYIGKALNLKERITTHNMKPDFDNKLSEGEELCYAYASVAEANLDRIENGLVFSQQPPLNTQYKRSFNYPPTRFIIEGKCALLSHTNFSIE